jgi:hypothetical protein
MEFSEYRDTVKTLTIGKKLPDSIYIHESAFGNLPEDLAVLALNVCVQFKIKDNSWNIIKFYRKESKNHNFLLSLQLLLINIIKFFH